MVSGVHLRRPYPSLTFHTLGRFYNADNSQPANGLIHLEKMEFLA